MSNMFTLRAPRRARRFAAVALLAAALAGCRVGGNNGTFKHPAQGAPYEIVIVADHQVWDGAAGDTLRQMFYRRFPMVTREETTFNVLRTLPAGFRRYVPRHRNILLTAIDPTAPQPRLTVGEDIYAAPQIVLNATAPDLASLTALIHDNRDDIMLLLEKAEKDRDVALAQRNTPPRIDSAIRAKFGFTMATGPEFKIRSESDNFLWLSYEPPTTSQGIIIYTYPFSGMADFRRDSLLAKRDRFVRRIPGEVAGSHMATNHEMAELVFRTFAGRSWSELHGFWRVEGDFMGGPYTNFSTYDAATGNVIAIDLYVYAPEPRQMQRNLIRQLEHYVHSAKLPSVSGASASGEVAATGEAAATDEGPGAAE
jgi:hypothetical protein